MTMNPERWQQVKDLFHSALEREPARRSAFLDETCDGDSSLRAEVESLIAAHERPGSFLDAPAYEVAAAMLADDHSELEAGRRIGHYQITGTLGEGGMGKVYLAQDTRLKRPVALKLLPASFVQDGERVRRFEQEARAASALNHPNILTIHEIGTDGDHAHFIATEFVEGVTLRQHIKQAPLKLHEVLEVAIQTAAALSAAHAARIVHRDIKPENLMVRPDGYVKVLDFGLAKLTEPPPVATSDSDSLSISWINTQPGMVMGTICYMSPEQARGLEVDARTDIWSLGCVIYEMIAGHPPFRGATNSDVMVSVLDREPPPLTGAAPGVSSELERIVTKALAKDRDERYQTVKDMLIDLRRHRQRLEFEAEMSRSASRIETGEAHPGGALVRKDSGAQLAQTSSEQRKQVTVLFADLSGFTAISETLDAEEVNDHMNALWNLMDTAILDHGGMIDKHMGDTVMALWGTRAAHEDDPERAIRAALTMQAEVSDYVRLNLDERIEPEMQQRRPAIMRIGINTGPVFLSVVGSNGEWTATGAAVNVANRLEQAAPVGQTLISHDTYAQVRGVFDVREMELVTVKGKAEPVHTYVVERAKPRAFRLRTRGVEGVETRMIGRKAELDRLMDAMQIVLEDREPRAITVIGDAGLGKSRLLYEFSNEVELLPDRVRIFNGRATQGTRGLPYSLVRDVFSFRFEIQDSDSAAVARDKLEQGMLAFTDAGDESRMRAHFIGHLIGLDFSASPYLSGILDDAKQIRDRAFHYAAQFFAVVARDAPVVLYLDDIHWADDGSLDFVDYLARTCADVPMLILCLARPVLLERRPSWGEGEAAHTRVQLQPLSKRESRHLVEEILRHAQSIPQVLRELVVSGAEGNPFYMEELIKMLIDQKVIVPGAEQWRVDASRLVEVRVPPTLTGVLQARLDGLSLWEKTVLQRASVVGREFWDRAVEQLGAQSAEARSDPAEAADVRAALESLRRKELVYRREASGFAGTTEYVFKHALLRDVTYESVLKRERRRYHHEVARWLIERSGERVDEYAGTIAEHYERARELIQSAGWYGRAGQQAREAYAPETAIGFYRKALEFMPAGTEAGADEAARSAQRVEWYEGLGEVLWMQARFTEAVETYVKMRSLAEECGDVVAQARAWNGLASAQDRQGDYRAMLESARRAETLAGGAGDASLAARKELARSLDRQGWALQRLGDAAAAMTLCEQALLISTELGKEARRERAHSLKSIGVAHTMLGHFEQAESYSEQALSLHRELGNRRGVGNMLNSLGETARLRGDHTAAVARYREALTITREIGDRANEMTYLSNLGGARIGLGDYVAAEADLRQVILMAGTSRFYALSETYFFLAEALLGQGKTAEALEASRHALVLGQATGNPEYIGGAWRTLGLVASQFPEPIMVDNQPLDACACFAESLRVWTDTGMEAERARTLRACAQYEQQRGDRARAHAMMQEAREIFTRLGMKLELERMAQATVE